MESIITQLRQIYHCQNRARVTRLHLFNHSYLGYCCCPDRFTIFYRLLSYRFSWSLHFATKVYVFLIVTVSSNGILICQFIKHTNLGSNTGNVKIYIQKVFKLSVKLMHNPPAALWDLLYQVIKYLVLIHHTVISWIHNRQFKQYNAIFISSSKYPSTS